MELSTYWLNRTHTIPKKKQIILANGTEDGTGNIILNHPHTENILIQFVKAELLVNNGVLLNPRQWQTTANYSLYVCTRILTLCIFIL